MNAPGSAAAPDTPPSSPWAQRYPLKESVVVVGNKKRSLLRPHYPSIEDPKYYDQDLKQIVNLGIWNPTEVDTVLWSEKIQRRTFWGSRTWQLAALNRYLKFHAGPPFVPVPSGHKPPVDKLAAGVAGLKISSYLRLDPVAVHDRRKIKIEEREWLSFLHKDRWFDWIQTSPGKRKRPIKTWSVDEEDIWLALRPVLELTNRFFQALIDDSHPAEDWRNFSDVFGEAPVEDATVLISYEMEEIIAKKRNKGLEFDHALVRTNQQVRNRLEKLLSSLIWGFGDLQTSHAFTCEPSKGFASMAHNYTIMVTLNIAKIQGLLNPDLTIRELCVLQFDLANLLLHEIAHAILCSRNSFVGNRSSMQNENATREPYYDGKWLPEAGFIMEQLVFGGVHESLPYKPDGVSPPPMLHVLREWPYASHAKLWPPADWDSTYLKDGALTRTYVLPATYSSKLLSEEFWEDPLIKCKSDNYFHNSRIFRVTAPIRNLRTTRCGTPKVVKKRRNQPRYPEDKILIQEWNAQKEALEKYQEIWLHKDYAKWDASPWSAIWPRQALRSFADAFEERDHIECARLARGYIEYVDWSHGHNEFAECMPTNEVASAYWIWHCIGLLMLASLPIRTEPLVENETPTHYIVELAPSKAAAAGGRVEQVYNWPDTPEPTELVVPVSEFYDQTCINGYYGKGRVRDFSQRDYLVLVGKVIRMIMYRQGRVYIKFVDAINKAKKKLSKQRFMLEEDYPRGAHKTRWVSKWPFELPEYDPTVMIHSGIEWEKPQS
ncbi:hypothetical protein F5B22DRAFT_647892 [Xylaria bambusicola]|uniref:uncharacterized protein n=1 Tax=Xylaria bambusicola TaxID=326684 RepID=UPI0020072838|nr:uncharacterized protein F5B22DRAFT_647892 [Xylaria bambusicola]KAI0513341.1 hypothetical protein F5B22DRAFT_647892 [Xylaria bambusicola]